MLFNSFEFLLFFPTVTALFFALPHRFRWMLLLAASCVFYMTFIPVYILILMFTIGVDYVAGILIEQQADQSRRRLLLAASIVANVGVLGVFKYANFVNGNLASLAGLLHWNYPIENLAIILPIGLSFHTFQAMSYTIEVFRGRQQAERHLGLYALYIMFYPQLVAGPIERPYNLLHQFREQHTFDYYRVTDGLRLMSWGLFKKVVIADRLAPLVNRIYDHPYEFEGFALTFATVLFAFQIFCDFSGYSDIAIGAAQVMGFKLSANFRRPYFARSVSEFWRRWHISLSTWFRDYVYIPLGGSRVQPWRWQVNLLIVFLVSGLWHGASWTFVVWGGLHGLYVISSIWMGAVASRLPTRPWMARLMGPLNLVKIAVTFALVCFAWIFFRARTLTDAAYIVSHLFAGWDRVFTLGELGLRAPLGEVIIGLVMIGIMESIHLVQERRGESLMLVTAPIWVRWPVYVGFVTLILAFGRLSGEASQFIYFQF